MIVTVTEFRRNMSKYVSLSGKEDILITQRGKIVSKLTAPDRERVETAESLFGILPDTLTFEETRKDRFSEIS